MTVVIPTFNRSNVLRLAIESVLAQTMEDFELLVIGDCCTDDSEEVVGAFGDERISWFNLDANVGHQIGPNNEGLRRARGNFLAYLGHDDLWLPNHLEVLSRALSSGAPFAFARLIEVPAGRSPYIYPSLGTQRSLRARLTRRVQPPFTWSDDVWLPPTAVAHRIDLAREVGGWRLPSATDPVMDPETDLWRRLALRGGEPAEETAITSVKFSAATRKDVYRSRPCDEQQRYWRAIREERCGDRLFHRATHDDQLRTPRCGKSDRAPMDLYAAAPSFEERHRLRRQFRGLPPGPLTEAPRRLD